ncbi:MAG: hypothetical protein H6978_05175 [Gammaproteobacteria bacterium]|nr:hypothetical protein [Gammaproteobacteria bacterium]
MTNRRDFLRSTVAVSASSAAASATTLVSGSVFAEAGAPIPLAATVIDARHDAARRFGTEAEARGIQQHTIVGNITDVWQHHLARLWRSSDQVVAVAGLTEGPALFVLERLAWDHGLRVVFEAEHAWAPHGTVDHRVMRSTDNRLPFDLRQAGQHWPVLLVQSLLAEAAAPVRQYHPTAVGMAAYPGEAAKLYSWIIAPRTAAAA